MAWSRASSAWPAVVVMTPASATTTPPATASSTPNPVATRPGSTPMILSACAPGLAALAAGPGPAAGAGRRPGGGPSEPSSLRGGDGVDDLVGDVVVRVHGLDVVLLLEGLD